MVQLGEHLQQRQMSSPLLEFNLCWCSQVRCGLVPHTAWMSLRTLPKRTIELVMTMFRLQRMILKLEFAVLYLQKPVLERPKKRLKLESVRQQLRKSTLVLRSG